MSYDGNDLGYDLGYDSEPIRSSKKSIQKADSPETQQITYYMTPKMPPVVTPKGSGDPQPPPAGGTGKSGGTDKTDKKDASPPKPPKPGNHKHRTWHPTKTSVNLGLGKGEIAYKTDGYLFSDQVLLENASPAKTKSLDTLSKKDIKDKKLQKTIVELAFSKTKGSEKAQDKKAEELAGKDKDKIKVDAHKANAQRYAEYYRKHGVDPEVAKANMVARGVIDAKTEFPKSWPHNRATPALAADKIVPPHGGTTKEADEALVRTYGQFDALPDIGKKTSKSETDAIIKKDTERVTVREEWVNAALAQKKVATREEGYKLFYQAVPKEAGKKKEEFDPAKARAALFKDAKPVLPKETSISPAEYAAYLKNPAQVLSTLKSKNPDKAASIQEFDKYMKMSSSERADYKKAHPVSAAQFETQAHSVRQSELMGLMTDKGPKGMGLSAHDAKGLLSSDAFGDPPLFDADGNLKTAEELGISQEAYEARLSKVKQELVDKRKEVYGGLYQFDENGEPVQQKVDDPDNPGKQIGATRKDGTPIYAQDPNLKTDHDIRSAEETAAKKKTRWVADKREKAIKFHRDRLVRNLDRIGVDAENIGIWMNGHGFYGEDPDIGEMAKQAQALEKIESKKGKPSQEAKDKKKEILRYNEGKTAPKVGSYQAQTHNEVVGALNPKDKGKGAGGRSSGGKVDQRQLQEDQQAFQKAESEKQRAFQKWQTETQNDFQREMERTRHQNAKELEDYREKIAIRGDRRRAGFQWGQMLGQGLVQTMGDKQRFIDQVTMANLQKIDRGIEALMQNMYGLQQAILGGLFNNPAGRRR